MNVHTIDHFIEYAELDQKIDRLAQEYVVLTNKLEQTDAKRLSLLAQTVSICQNAHSLRNQIGLVELELRTLTQKLTSKQKLLATTSSVKEYGALEHEIESILGQQAVLEEQGLLLLDRYENAQKACEVAQAQESIELKLLDEEKSELDQRAQEVEALKNAYTGKKKADERSLDQELLNLYRSMKERVSNPVVPLINGQCSACFYSVSPKDSTEIAGGHLIRCKNCYRFLYTHYRGESHAS